jgi:predicted HTH domain antitoxin
MRDTLSIEISRPRTVAELDGLRREASEQAYAEGVFDLIRQGVVSVGHGAALVGIGVDAMLDALRERGIPVADYPGDELSAEVAAGLGDFDGENSSDS